MFLCIFWHVDGNLSLLLGNCYKGDLVCEKDKLGYEAIASLHAQMDDDQNGDIDLEESAEVRY